MLEKKKSISRGLFTLLGRTFCHGAKKGNVVIELIKKNRGERGGRFFEWAPLGPKEREAIHC